MSGQSIVDRLNAAKHTVAGSALGRAVVKATTEEIAGPKRKHLEYLLACTSEINVSIPQMADLLIERTQNTSWVVTYKSLITIHHLMCYGNERFSQYMASHNSKFMLNNFMDKTGVAGMDMTSYIRKYAHYLNEKRETYKLMGFDFCKVKRGKDDGMLRTMSAEKLIKTLPILQKQLDALVQFDIAANELTNGVINSSFCLLSKDLIRLFACYNDGIINLLEKFFDMNKKMCKEALEIYKKFLERTDNVSAFLKIAESSGIDKSDIPDLAKAPSSLLDALESHVYGPDAKKTSGSASNHSQSNTKSSVNTAISSLQTNNTVLSAEEQRRVLEEEAKVLESYKKSHLTKQASVTSHSANAELNPFANGQPPKQQQQTTTLQDDLFGLDLTQPTPTFNNHPTSTGSSASDDLLMLSGANPFIQNIVNQQQYSTQGPTGMNFFGNGGGMQQQQQQPINLFQQQQMPSNGGFNNNQNKFDDLFSGLNFSTSTQATTPLQPTSEFDAFGDVLRPTVANSSVLQPMQMNKQPTTAAATTSGGDGDKRMLSTDLESSLASLADNLDINRKNNNFQKNSHQWNPNAQQGQQGKTGGQNWNTNPTSTAPTLSSPISGPSWGAPAVNNMQSTNAFNPFATAMQPATTTPAAPVQMSNNPFDLF